MTITTWIKLYTCIRRLVMSIFILPTISLVVFCVESLICKIRSIYINALVIQSHDYKKDRYKLQIHASTMQELWNIFKIFILVFLEILLHVISYLEIMVIIVYHDLQIYLVRSYTA